MKLTVMTYNICSGRNLARERNIGFAASVIGAAQPDFVALNEVRSGTRDVDGMDQAAELGRAAGYQPVFGRSIDIDGGQYGNALLTHLPIVSWEVVHIPDRTSDEKVYYEHRSVLRCVLKADEREITVLCTHFGLARVEAEAAVETVLALLDQETRPVLLMGDLNLRPADPLLRPLMERLRDTAMGLEEICTFPSDKPAEKIDYIFTTQQLRAVSLRSMDTQCSDHRPLIAELELV